MKVGQQIRLWQRVILIGGLVSIVVLAALPSDPDSAWLLGYSRLRWIETGFILVLLLAASGISRIFSRSDQDDSAFKQIRTDETKLILIETAVMTVNLGILAGIVAGIVAITNTSIYQTAALRALPVAIFLIIFHAATIWFLGSQFYEQSLTRSKQVVRLITVFTMRSKFLPILSRSFRNGIDWVDNAIERASLSVDSRVLSVILVSLPFIGTLLLLRLVLNSGIQDYFPTRFDDVDYWRQTYSFVKHGFEFGQYSNDELVAPAGFSRFGLHGPSFPILYGLAGKLVGWHTDTAIWLNLVLMTAGLIAYILVARPDRKQLLVTMLFLITFWPVWLYLPRNMQEVVHYAFGFVLGALWFRQMVQGGKHSRWLWLAAAVLAFLSAVRFTWALVFLGIFLTLWKAKKEHLWLRWAASIAAFLASGLLFTWWNVPWPTFSFYFMQAMRAEGLSAVSYLFENFFNNLRNLVSFSDDGWYVIAFRFQFLIFVLAAAAAFLLTWHRGDKRVRPIAESAAVLVVPVYLLVVFLNNMVDTRDYRNLAPHLLVAVLILILTNKHRWVYAVIALNLVAAGSFGQRYTSYANAYQAEEARQTATVFAGTVAPYLRYKPEGNRWCNAVTIEYLALSPDGKNRESFAANQFLLIDPGIGLGFVTDWGTAEKGLKARYLFVDPDAMQTFFPGVMDSFSLTPLVEFNTGTLFLNTKSACNLIYQDSP